MFSWDTCRYTRHWLCDSPGLHSTSVAGPASKRSSPEVFRFSDGRNSRPKDLVTWMYFLRRRGLEWWYFIIPTYAVHRSKARGYVPWNCGPIHKPSLFKFLESTNIWFPMFLCDHSYHAQYIRSMAPTVSFSSLGILIHPRCCRVCDQMGFEHSASGSLISFKLNEMKEQENMYRHRQ